MHGIKGISQLPLLSSFHTPSSPLLFPKSQIREVMTPKKQLLTVMSSAKLGDSVSMGLPLGTILLILHHQKFLSFFT